MVATKRLEVGHGDGRRKISKNGEDGSYHTAQVGCGDERRARLEYDAATKRLGLTMETDEEKEK